MSQQQQQHFKEKEKEKGNDFNFKWGKERGVGGKNGDIVFYESFTYGGERYCLYDCVYLDLGQPEASIGKIVKMFEGQTRVKKVKVVWFMRPREIRNFLGDYHPPWDEIFLASGHGLGLSNINPLESIAGKCNVVCTSNDPRNPQPSETDLRQAEFFFCRHFDVGKLAILDVFPDTVDGVKVEEFFNKKKEQKLLGSPKLKSNVAVQTGIRIKIKKETGGTVRDDYSGNRVSQLMKESTTVPVSVSKQVRLSSESTPPRPKTSIPSGGNQHGGNLQCQVQEEVKDPKSNVTEQTGIRIKIKKEIGGTARDDNSGDRVSQLMKESMAVPVSVSKQVHLSSESTPPGPKTSIPSSGNQHGGNLQCQVQEEVKDPKHSPISTEGGYETKIEKFQKPDPCDLVLGLPAETQPFKKRKLLEEKASSTFDNLDHQLGQDRGINIDDQLVQVSRRPDADKRNWFRQLPWEQKLERAEEAGCLVSLENLDASYTSDEVEDLLWLAFKEKVEAKMIQQSTFSCPHYGKALIIFKSKEAAQSAIVQLMERCLMLADGRPVIARKETLRKPGRGAGFVGHLTIDRVQLLRQSEDMRKAMSTSHPSQPNNMEYDFGMEWRQLQAKSDILCKKLYERQTREIQDVRDQLKMNWNS